MKLMLEYLKKYSVPSSLGPFFKLVEACLSLLIPLAVSETIDKGVHMTEKNYIFGRVMMIVVLGLVGFACALIAQYFAVYSASGTFSDIKSDVFLKVNRMKTQVIDGFSVSEIISRMTEDAGKVQAGISMGLRLILSSPAVVIGAIVMAFTIDVKYAFIFALVIPILFAVVYSTMFLTIPGFKKQDGESDVEEGNDEKESGNESGILAAIMNPLTYAVINIIVILLVRLGTKQITVGSVTTGSFVALMDYMILILIELVRLANFVVVINKATFSATRIDRLLKTGSIIEKETKSEEPEKKEAVPVETKEAETPQEGDEYVMFDNVSLMYGAATEAAVTNLSFFVNKGELVVITGSTGSGKTSVVSMITGMYEATEGEVRLFGRPIRDIPMKEIRSRVHVALQNAPVFKGSFRDNLTMGMKNVTDEEILEAVEVVGASDFITPGRLEYSAEQEGRNLTAGQRQRMQLIRLLLHQSDVMIFDDALSSLDYETEINFWNEFENRRSETAVIVVTQRISGLIGADRIIVMDEGAVIGMGGHNELLENCSKYKEIYMAGML